MSESKTGGVSHPRPLPPSRRRYSDEFKQSAVRLVVKETYSFKAAAEAGVAFPGVPAGSSPISCRQAGAFIATPCPPG